MQFQEMSKLLGEFINFYLTKLIKLLRKAFESTIKKYMIP